MSVRRLDCLGLALAMSLVGTTAQAQLTGGQWRLIPARQGGRTAVEAKRAPTVIVQPGILPGVMPSQPVAFTFVPAILMSDGRVFANFGAGFEPIVRPCFGTTLIAQPGAGVVSSNGGVLYQPQRPTYTQPVPSQPTASQQMLRMGQTAGSRGGAVYLYGGASLACFSMDAAGRVFAYRF